MHITTDREAYIQQLGEANLGQSNLQAPPPESFTKKPRRRISSELTLFTCEEAANALHEGITIQSIYAAIKSGALKARSIGRSQYITKEELENFVRCHDQDCQRDCGNAKMTKPGSFTTEKNVSGLDVAMASVNRQKRPSKNT